MDSIQRLLRSADVLGVWEWLRNERRGNAGLMRLNGKANLHESDEDNSGTGSSKEKSANPGERSRKGSQINGEPSQAEITERRCILAWPAPNARQEEPSAKEIGGNFVEGRTDNRDQRGHSYGFLAGRNTFGDRATQSEGRLGCLPPPQDEWTEDHIVYVKDQIRKHGLDSASGDDAILYAEILEIPNDALVYLCNECVRRNGPSIWFTTAIIGLLKMHLSKADRDYRYRRDQLTAETALARQNAQSERAARYRTRSISPSAYTPQTTTSLGDATDTSLPSTPTISTPSDLSLSPETSPARLSTLLPAFFTPKPIRTQRSPRRSPSPATNSSEDEMTPKSVELFRGNCAPEKAHIWLRTLEGGWKYNTKEEEKLYQFEKGLHPGAQADEWWGELKAGEKDTWGRLLGAFERKWPKPKAARRAMDIVLEDISTNVLSHEDLGKLVKLSEKSKTNDKAG
ncbi:hypothetical protein B0H14DRAFT_3612592 [Mycena olivaceomarginata]|nr:hypothetical protein B0H14DRAFT_3612592 [Mycena olivaceomarginata]